MPIDPKSITTKPAPGIPDVLANDDRPSPFGDGEKSARKSGLFARFQDAIQTSRGDERGATESPMATPANTDDLAMRRAKSARTQRMIVPEGVVIEGSFSSGSDTDIAGRVNGDVSVESKLLLGPSATVTGNVRAAMCSLEGLVEGHIECGVELELSATGRLNADAIAGKKMTVAGEIHGNVTCGGTLRLVSSAKVTGNIRARVIVIEEGAVFNGTCSMSAPKPKATT